MNRKMRVATTRPESCSIPSARVGVTDMNTTFATRPHKSLAVTVVGLATLLLGVGYTILGCVFIYSGVHAAQTLPDDDATQGWGPFLAFVSGIVALIGVLFVAPGVVGIAAGAGVLYRKSWGRVLTFLIAAVAIVWGVAFVAISDHGGTLIAFGVAQIVYGVAAVVVMFTRSEDFARFPIPDRAY